jgi:hypothetical protein
MDGLDRRESGGGWRDLEAHVSFTPQRLGALSITFSITEDGIS